MKCLGGRGLRSFWVVILVPLVGCASSERNRHVSLEVMSEQYDMWSALALCTFDSARFYKPDTESTHVSALALQFPPLIVQESGRMLPANDAAGDNASPVMYVDTKRLRVAGSFYDQVTYQWLASRDTEMSVDSAGDDLSIGDSEKVRGIRITVGQDGFAAVCEVLQPGSPFRRFFVSKSMEEAARKAYGEPLEGRRFAVESAIDAAPDVLVVGVFNDGPVTMGPYVYLDASLAVTTIRCRCSSSLVDAFSEEAVYQWLPIEAFPQQKNRTREREDLSILSVLRWPKGF